MKLLYFCPRWGSNDIPWDIFLKNVVAAGYDGVEIGLPDDDREARDLIAQIKGHHLLYIIQHYETVTASFGDHKVEYECRLNRIAGFAPFSINSHTGRDLFSCGQNLELLNIASSISDKYKVEITHETHRSRFSYGVHRIVDYLNNINIKLTLDVSHWFCVAESLLSDQQESVSKAISHIHHIHARFGYTQGPQIDNPDLSIWAETKKAHLKIWDKVVSFQQNNGKEYLQITCEFGPWPYMREQLKEIDLQKHQFNLNKQMLAELKLRYSNPITNNVSNNLYDAK